METTNTIYDFLGTCVVKLEEDIFNYICEHHSDIIYVLFSNMNYKTKYSHLFHDPKFLSVFNQALNKIELSQYEMIYINSILYYYIVNDNPNMYIKHLWYMIGNTINKDIIYQLNNLNVLDSELCSFLAITNMSTLTEYTRIQRLNFTLCTSAIQQINVNDFISIYKIFYIKSFSNLLLYSLFDTSIDNIIDNKENNIIYQNTNTARWATIYILESMNMLTIIRYLQIVYDAFSNKYNYDPESLKISFSTLDKNVFPNITQCIEQLRNEGNILP